MGNFKEAMRIIRKYQEAIENKNKDVLIALMNKSSEVSHYFKRCSYLINTLVEVQQRAVAICYSVKEL
jgi:hypothetical protein